MIVHAPVPHGSSRPSQSLPLMKLPRQSAIGCTKTRGLFREPFERMVARNGGSKIKAIAALARKLAPVVLEIARTGRPFDLARWERERRLGLRSEGEPAVPGPSGTDGAGAWEGTL